MVKLVALVRSSDTAGRLGSVASLVERLKAAWIADGLPIGDLRGLVVSEVIRPLDEASGVDAMIQLWRDELTEGEQGVGHLLPRNTGGDVRGDVWLTREHVFKAPTEREREDGPPQVIKLTGTAHRRDDFSRDAFFEYWRTVHAPISAPVVGGGYVVSEILERLAGDLCADAIVELWYPDEATFARLSSTPDWEIAEGHVSSYAKPVGVFWLMREHVLVPPPPTGPGLLELSRV